MQLPNFIKAIFSKLIVRKINPNELDITRCVIQPYHYKNKILPAAFEPPKSDTAVSLVRLKYTHENIAKRDGIKLASCKPQGSEFKGLVIINNRMLNEINNSNIGLSAYIAGTPLDENGNYISTNLNVYKCDRGKPYHADIIYSEPKPAGGEPATKFREYSNSLAKMVQSKNLFVEDRCPNLSSWCSELISNVVLRNFN